MLSLNLPAFDAKIIVKDGKKAIFDIIRRRYVALTPEEWVRQHFVQYLIREKGYPAGRIGNEISLIQNGRKRRCDTVIYDTYGLPFVIVEYKAPHVEITQAVFDQIVRYNSVLQVRYLIVSNGIAHYCCKVDYVQNQCHFLSDIPQYRALNHP